MFFFVGFGGYDGRTCLLHPGAVKRGKYMPHMPGLKDGVEYLDRLVALVESMLKLRKNPAWKQQREESIILNNILQFNGRTVC